MQADPEIALLVVPSPLSPFIATNERELGETVRSSRKKRKMEESYLHLHPIPSPFFFCYPCIESTGRRRSGKEGRFF